MTTKEKFISIMKKHGQCYVNYLMGATLHYILRKGRVIESYLNGTEVYGLCRLDADNLEDWVDLTGVCSLTARNISQNQRTINAINAMMYDFE